MSEKASYFNERLGCHSERPEEAKNLEAPYDAARFFVGLWPPQNDSGP